MAQSFYDFDTSDEEIRKILDIALAKGCRYADIYFEYSISNIITMEEGIVKEGVKSISLGAGIRAVKGEGTGYAYTEEISFERMKRAAQTAAAIADSTCILLQGPSNSRTVPCPRVKWPQSRSSPRI